MVNLQTKILKILRSPQFFAAILILFFIESVWIAFSAVYPMVFDENTHFGIIQMYAHQWGPFLPAHLAATDAAGAIVRDPSFLYHYLMSFPYRLIAAVTSDQMIQVIDLRFINIFLFGGGLVLFRRLLLKTKVSPAIVHATLLFFVLTPVVPLLAGEINYDNMLMPLVALTLLLTLTINDSLRQGKLPALRAAWLLALCLLASLVQVEFLPIFVAIVAWLAWQLFRAVKAGGLRLDTLAAKSWRQSSWVSKSVGFLPVTLALYLSFQMFGINLIRYHTLTPSCGQVLTAQQCSTNANWVRTQNALAHRDPVNSDPVVFATSWTYRMFVALFFTNSGGAGPQANYLNVNPLPLIFGAALAVFGLGAILFIRYRQALFKGYEHLEFLLFVSFTYAGILWLHNYHDYLRFGQKFAIQGRYIFPVALPILLILALALRQSLGNRVRLKMALALAALVLFLQGGGALTYIIDSNHNWYWQNKAIVRLNELAQQAVKPFILIKTPLRNVGRLD
jgi:hypothetical protein